MILCGQASDKKTDRKEQATKLHAVNRKCTATEHMIKQSVHMITKA